MSLGTHFITKNKNYFFKKFKNISIIYILWAYSLIFDRIAFVLNNNCECYFEYFCSINFQLGIGQNFGMASTQYQYFGIKANALLTLRLALNLCHAKKYNWLPYSQSNTVPIYFPICFIDIIHWSLNFYNSTYHTPRKTTSDYNRADTVCYSFHCVPGIQERKFYIRFSIRLEHIKLKLVTP